MARSRTIRQPMQILKVGSVRLIPLAMLRGTFKMSVNALTRFLEGIHVPVLHVSTLGGYVLSATLEEALVGILDYGKPGYAAPGSAVKASSLHPGGCLFTVPSPTTKSRRDSAAMLKAVRSGGAKSVAQHLKNVLRANSPLVTDRQTTARAQEAMNVTDETSEPALQDPLSDLPGPVEGDPGHDRRGDGSPGGEEGVRE